MKSRFNIFSASAGSGKTFTLAVQFISRLIATQILAKRGKGESIAAHRQILAVTFTNKATTEMKDRIIEQLYGIAHGLESSKGYLDAIQQALRTFMGIDLDVKDIQSESEIALQYILHDYSRFRVETIDAFFQSVLINMSHELGLPVGLRTDIDQPRAVNEAVNRIFARLDQTENIRRWIKEYITEQIDDGGNWNVSGKIKAFAGHIFDLPYIDNSESLTHLFDDTTKSELLRHTWKKLLKGCYDELTTAADNLAAAAPSAIVTTNGVESCYSNDIINGRNIDTLIGKMRGIKENSEHEIKTDSVRNKFLAPDTIIRGKDKKPLDEELACRIIKNLQRAIDSIEKNIKKINTLNIALKYYNQLRLLNAVNKAVAEVTAEKGNFLLANTPILLRNMLAPGDASFIYEKMGEHLHHIMLDEFQDTSQIQWHNFLSLICNNMDAGGTTLVVGDIKQSIYRWRDGDWNILHNLKENMRRYDAVRIPLNENHRSDRNIITFNNLLYSNDALIAQVNKFGHDVTSIYSDAYQNVPSYKADNEGKGYIQVRSVYAEHRQDIDERILKNLCETIACLIKGGHKPSSIAILLRRKLEQTAIANAFALFLPDIPLVSSEVFKLSQSPAVNILIEALRVLHRPDDTPAIGRLIYLYQRHIVKAEIDLNAWFVDNRCKDEGHFAAACRLLPSEFADITTLRRMPIYELLIKLSEMFGIKALTDQSAYLLAFYDQISDCLADNYGSLAMILQYWDEVLCDKTVPGGDIEGVNMLTIHKSKGLEYDTVLIPYCDWKLEDAQTHGNIIWCKNADKASYLRDIALTAAPITEAVKASEFENEYQAEREAERIDNLNLLYVATTRAKKNLFIWDHHTKMSDTTKKRIASEGEKGTDVSMGALILRSLLPSGSYSLEDDIIEYTFGKLHDCEKPKKKKQTTNRMSIDYSPLPVDCTPYTMTTEFKQSNEALRFMNDIRVDDGFTNGPSVKQQSFINTGIALHEILAHIKTTHDIPRAIASLPVGIATSKGRDLADMAQRLIANGMKDAIVKDWFEGNYHVYNECTIIDPDPNTAAPVEHRPDRVMVSHDGKQVIVVDYKFGTAKTDYKTQVRTYMRLLQNIYPDAEIRGYLWYIYNNNVEPVTAQ